MQFFKIDAFTDQPFCGNPAAVCLMEDDADVDWMQAVAKEMRLSETAFVRKVEGGFHLRWFTPAVEVDLCGHATLAASYALWESGWQSRGESISFFTKSGTLKANSYDDEVFLDFPSKPAAEVELPDGLAAAMGIMPSFCGKNDSDLLMQVDSYDEVVNAQVDFARLRELPLRGVILTAVGNSDRYDFVSRFFAPAVGVDEDPVTGSAHVCLAPFWSQRLGRDELVGYQASERGGFVKTRLAGDRVHLGGKAVIVVEGNLRV